MNERVHAADDTGWAFTVQLRRERDTVAAGTALAPSLHAGLVIHLTGDLGAGKTTFVRGVLRALGHAEKVKSPTYTLIEPYTVSRLHLYHFDFYRFKSPEEFLDAGLDEYFAGNGVCLVEWPDKAAPYAPAPDVDIHLAVDGIGRRLTVHARTEGGRTCMIGMKASLEKARGASRSRQD